MVQNTPEEVMDPRIADWNPEWSPRFVKTNLQLRGEAFVSDLRTGNRLAVKFDDKPSGRWRDPMLSSIILLDSVSSFGKPISPSTWERTKPASIEAEPTDRWQGLPLCIPTFEVPVEWRLESYVYEEPWGTIKNHLVGIFLSKCTGKQIECAVVSTKRSADHRWSLVVQSPDYDAFLQMHWPYYKGLESALSRGRYFKSRAVLSLSEEALIKFASELVGDSRFRDLIPRQFRERIKERAIQERDVYLMLKGIIVRESAVVSRWEANHGSKPGLKRRTVPTAPSRAVSA